MEAIGYTNVVKQSMESMFELFEKNYPKVDTAFWNEFRKETECEARGNDRPP